MYNEYIVKENYYFFMIDIKKNKRNQLKTDSLYMNKT